MQKEERSKLLSRILLDIFNIKIIVTSLFILCNCKCSAQCIIIDTISFVSYYRKLTIEDFKFKKVVSDTNKYYRYYNDENYVTSWYRKDEIDSEVAETSVAGSDISIKINYEVNGDRVDYCVQNIFSRFTSYMIVKKKFVLLHEQIHFDIYELCARELRMRIAKKLSKVRKIEIDDTLAKWEKEMHIKSEDLNFYYDFDVMEKGMENSKKSVDSIWQKKIGKQLSELRRYSNHTGYVILKK